ncbi:hypothetical protein E8E12_010737 [Didymella heteroderae]|uniref:Heterokaryon incompatibility domain-containing protein n=1 Tax=Didymella heteroderae TaxID=1769908 RepID=A0A9P5C5M0_9PLEO|nr:hypothetical protein E8E12_010737 [Didymella heteroderae]
MKARDEQQPSLDQSTIRGLTRRIRMRWNSPLLEDAYLVLVAQERHLTTNSDAHRVWSSASLFLGREIHSNGNIQARIKSWLDLCRQKHCVSCTAPRGKTKRKFDDLLEHSYFGVIDVLNMQLTELPVDRESGPAPYAALSYVWGTTPTFTSTLKNINLLRMHGGLETKLDSLPVVIRDAIDLVRRLGLQFLWIDSLCITQDSPKSWKLNAYSMDTIYGNAELTICAADGVDASTGLVAMRPPATMTSPTAADCGPGVRLMITRPPEMYIQASKWNTRAWTFQERILSRRCLIFINGRVYYQCRATGMSEDIYADREGAGWSLDLVDAPLQMWKQLSDRSFWVYMNVARLYSSRQLTHLKDISAAFSGIANMMECTMSAPFAFGLPTSHFDLALLWRHPGTVNRRIPRGSDETSDYNGLQFPSWSWMGWTGSSTTYEQDMLRDCLDDPNEWLAMHTWVRWYIRDGRGDLRPLWTERGWKEDKSKDVKWRGYTPERTSANMMTTHHSQRGRTDFTGFGDVPASPRSASTVSSRESERTDREAGYVERTRSRRYLSKSRSRNGSRSRIKRGSW